MSVRVLEGDCCVILPTLPAESVQCVVTSPPYWGLRDYGVEGQLGLEPTPEAYVAAMVGVFGDVRRVLRDDGVMFVNMGDCYLANQGAGFDTNGDGGERKALAASPKLARPSWLKPKDLVGMPWRLAFALQADGWYLRADIIWAKPNPMPESVTDRPTKAHEYIFLLTKQARYYWDADAVREPATYAGKVVTLGEKSLSRGQANGAGVKASGNGLASSVVVADGRNLRSVWTIPSAPWPLAHFATFPPALASRCIQAGTSERGCCAACGAPWARQTEREATTCDGRARPSRSASGERHRGDCDTMQRGIAYRVQTLGWQPSCACDAPVMPCTVLDPFGGSGTVGAVAEQLGRHSILIELSAPYVAMAKQRTAQRGLFTWAPQAEAG